MATGITDILIGPATSIVIPDETNYWEVVKWIDTATSWAVEDAEHTDKFKDGRWDGRVHLFNRWTKIFPTGLLRRVICMLMSRGCQVRTYDERVYPDLSDCSVTEIRGIKLYRYQRMAVVAGLKAKAGVYCMAPGSGKTEVLISLAASLELYPTLWLTHTDTLLNQSYRRFCDRFPHKDIEIGMIGGGVWNPKDITISTWQSLYTRLGRARPVMYAAKVIISDETHRVPADCWYQLLLESQALFRYGCSATPFSRGDGSDLRLHAAIGGIIFTLTPEQGETIGVFMRPKVFMVEYDRTEVPVFNFDWEPLYRSAIVHNRRRNKAVIDIALNEVGEDRQVLILVNRIVHGRELERRLAEKLGYGGDEAVFLQGSTTRGMRDRAVQLFRDKVLKAVVATSIFDEGADIPEIDTVIVAAAGKSKIKAVQRGGRGMRHSKGKTEFRLYDFMDRYHRILLRHSQARASSYANLASTVETVEFDETCEGV